MKSQESGLVKLQAKEALTSISKGKTEKQKVGKSSNREEEVHFNTEVQQFYLS
jgi:hypothetical protein